MESKFTTPDDFLNNADYFSYLVKYQGNIKEEVSRYPGYYVLVLDDSHAIVSVLRDIIAQGKDINTAEPYFLTIVYVQPAEFFTLQQITPIQASNAKLLQLNLPLNLSGKGVNVAIVDSGIDFLSDEFIDSNGQTRIEYIWDQTISSTEKVENSIVKFGTLYTKFQIQEAINAHRQGNSPYDIVPSKDEIGHGTNMAGIIGATGKNSNLRGVVPDCTFVVVKLLIDPAFKKWFTVEVPEFNVSSIFAALEFLNRYASIDYKPLVIYLPVGSNLGSHKGNGTLEQYVDFICLKNGITVVTGAGNECVNGGHTSGIISSINGTSSMQLTVSPEQKDLWLEIWVDSPNIMSLDIISPSGENTNILSPTINITQYYTFLFEKTTVKVNYYLPEENTGDELIRIRFYDLQPGVWKLRLTGNSILDGKYNAWIPQSGISIGGTRFIPSDIYGTITNPGTSNLVITAAAYNQNNNNIVDYSGMAFLDDPNIPINIAAGGVNAPTIAPDNNTAVVNGTSVSAAIVAGACAMLFQWGIVNGNNPLMYSTTISTYLERGTTKRSGDLYPNPQWGYGILNLVTVFQNMI